MKVQFVKSIHVLLITVSLLFFITAPAQQQYFTGDNTVSGDLERMSRPADRATRDMVDIPVAFSLKQYAPPVGNQGMHGTCVAWSSSYAARTISYCIQHAILDPAKIKELAFSPGYLYYQVKNKNDTNCTGGANIEMALAKLTNKGDLLLSDNIPDCVSTIDNQSDDKARNYTIKAFTRLTNGFSSMTSNDISVIKKSLSEKKPVVISLKCMNSFFGVGKDGIWVPKANDVYEGNHAMCVVGYDDAKSGGAFEVMNSWGSNWGNRGFVWITYPQMQQYGNYAVEMMDREAVQPEINGSIDFVLLDGSSMPVKRTGITTRSISVEDDDAADYSSYSLKENYAGGTAFKIKFTTNAPAFVYLFSVDDKNVVSTLFPYAANISPAINSTNATVYLPAENKHARLSKEPGTEKICVLYSKSPLDFTSLMKQINQEPANMYETIMQQYKDQILPVKNISFCDDRITFHAKASEQQLVCFFINLNHK